MVVLRPFGKKFLLGGPLPLPFATPPAPTPFRATPVTEAVGFNFCLRIYLGPATYATEECHFMKSFDVPVFAL